MTISFSHVLVRQNRRSPSSMNRITSAAVLVCCSLLFSGCMVNFTNPLPGSRDFAADETLLGRWSGTDQQGNAGLIQFSKAGPREIAVSVFGKDDSDLGYKNPIFRLKTTKIGSFDYLILTADAPEARPDYTIARYSIVSNKLKIWMLSLEKVREAIKSGRLKGTTTGGPYDGAIISSPSSEVVRFLRDSRADEMFVSFGEYARVTK